jgi:hypothetical protein
MDDDAARAGRQWPTGGHVHTQHACGEDDDGTDSSAQK